MITARSPLRLSLGGGGTDLPSYYRKRGGFLIAGAMDHYVTVRAGDRGAVPAPGFAPVPAEEPLLVEALRNFGLSGTELAIHSSGDLPSGTGLGSSGSFTTALIGALAAHQGKRMSPDEIADLACTIEIDRLACPVGKQDQYAAAFGGLNCYHFHPDDTVTVEPLGMTREAQAGFAESCLLFFTGTTRSAAALLADQDHRTRSGEAAMLENLDQVKMIGIDSRRLLEAGDIAGYGELMHDHWELKKRRSPKASVAIADEAYDLARTHGAYGGKLVGAGGGGFLLLVAADPSRVRQALRRLNLEEVTFGFAPAGTEVIS